MTKASLWSEAVSRQKESGLPVSAFCRREGLKAGRFRYWKEKLSGRSDFAEIHVAADDAPVLAFPNGPVALSPTVEILFLSGDRIRVCGFSSLTCLAEIVRALRKKPS
jgi:hypothetical protein